MSQLAVVSSTRHGPKRWLRPSNYAFAATDALAPIVGSEIARAALSMPLGFLENSGHYTLVGVLSLIDGRNMFVAPDGRWLGGYVPACYRSYPFRLIVREGTEDAVVCVDEASNLVVEGSTTGNEFVDANGNASSALRPVIDLLKHVEESRRATNLAIAALTEAGVFAPWEITVKTAQGEQSVSGLHRIDEAALSTLPDALFLKLRAVSALPIAYSQLLSVGHLEIFERLARVQAQLAPPITPTLPENLDSFFGLSNEELMIKFD